MMEYLQNKKIIYIDMWLFGGPNGSIYINIEHGKDFYLSVDGPEDWVNTIYQSIEDMIINWEPQNKWITKYYYLLGILLYVILFIIIIQIYSAINTILHLNSSIYSILSTKGLLISSLLFSLSATMILLIEIKNLYPPIEFNFGPKHLQIEANKRNKIYTIMGIIIIPFIISLIIIPFIISLIIPHIG
jgi:hypothetical protein